MSWAPCCARACTCRSSAPCTATTGSTISAGRSPAPSTARSISGPCTGSITACACPTPSASGSSTAALSRTGSFPFTTGSTFPHVVPKTDFARRISAQFGYTVHEGDVIAGIAARLDPVKDIPTLIRAVALAQKACPQLRPRHRGRRQGAQKARGARKGAGAGGQRVLPRLGQRPRQLLRRARHQHALVPVGGVSLCAARGRARTSGHRRLERRRCAGHHRARCDRPAHRARRRAHARCLPRALRARRRLPP